MNRRELLKMLGAASLVPFLGIDNAKKSFLSEIDTDAVKEGYNLVIYGATPGGIACGIRAAREGLHVLIVNHTQHLGGMLVNGLGTMDTLYNGARAPIYDELRYSIYDYYRTNYGYASSQYESTNPGFPKTRFESHVVEQLINEMLEKNPVSQS